MQEAKYRTETRINMEAGKREWFVLDEKDEWVADCRNQHYADVLVEALNEREREFQAAAKASLERQSGALKKLAEL